MKHSNGYSEKFSSYQQKWKRAKQRYPNNGTEKQAIMKLSNMWSAKVKYWNIKGTRACRWPEWVVNWIMVVFVERENHEQVGYKKIYSVRMRNGTAEQLCRTRKKENEKKAQIKKKFVTERGRGGGFTILQYEFCYDSSNVR